MAARDVRVLNADTITLPLPVKAAVAGANETPEVEAGRPELHAHIKKVLRTLI